MATELHSFIVRTNFLEGPTTFIAEKAKEHPDLYKGVLILNHLFRAVSMWAFLKYHKSPMKTKLLVCFGGSLVYRLTVESNCAYKFALPSFGGAVAYLYGASSLSKVANGVAFHSLSAFGSAFKNLTPIAGYLVYITLTTRYDVDHPKHGCH